jgi:hypothetical protein
MRICEGKKKINESETSTQTDEVKKRKLWLGRVAHACNPRYSGGKNWEEAQF